MAKKAQLALIEPVEDKARGALQSWALVELMGHQRLVGLITVHPLEFPEMIRVDVPDLLKDGIVARAGLTRYVSPASLYGVTPLTEDAVRQMLPTISGAPAEARAFRGYTEDAY